VKALGLSLGAFGLCTVTMLAGCGQSQSTIQTPQVAPQGTPLPPMPTGIRPAGWLSPQAVTGGALIYVAYYSASEVLIYPEAGGQPVGEITDGVSAPYGPYVDQNGTLYVANRSSNTVTTYPAGSTSPSNTWSQDLNSPLYPIVDGDGDLFVSNSGNGTIVEYQPGSTSAYKVLQTPGSEVDGMDFDSKGNLYAAYRTGSEKREAAIEEFALGTTQGTVLITKMSAPQGLIVDSSGNILVVETTGKTSGLDFFPRKHKKPSKVIAAPSGDALTQLAMEANQSKLFASAIYDEWGVFTIPYPFSPSGTLAELIQTPSVIEGVAISNGQTF